MPPADDIQRYLTGAWRLMMGRPEGLDLLDISSDGFWNSFFAIILAVPVLGVTWVNYTNEIAGPDDNLASRVGIVALFAFVDLAAWIIPIIVLALAAGPLGIGDRFVHYVIASNWGSVITAWSLLPPSALELIGFDDENPAVGLLYMAIFVAVMVLIWRLTNSVLQKGPATATLVFSGMLAVGVFVYYSLMGYFGLLQEFAS
ncbi:MAG: transporter [Rhizobiaceae bacterium]